MTDGTSPRLDGRKARRNRKRISYPSTPSVPNPPNVRKPGALDRALQLLPPPHPDAAPLVSGRGAGAAPSGDLHAALQAVDLAVVAIGRAGGQSRSTGPVWDAYDLLLHARGLLGDARDERAAAASAIEGVD